MSPINVNPGAGGVRAHGISQIDAVPTTRNQPAAQSNPAHSATVILDEATALGIRIGANADGSELAILAPMRVPRETRRWFETRLEEHRAEVIEVIQKNAGRL